MKVSQGESEEEYGRQYMAKEIKSKTLNILRKENALLFDKMLSECRHNKDYIKTASCKGEDYSAESLFMLLVLQQQKMINELINKASELQL